MIATARTIHEHVAIDKADDCFQYAVGTACSHEDSRNCRASTCHTADGAATPRARSAPSRQRISQASVASHRKPERQ